MPGHHQKLLMRSIEQRIKHIDMAFEDLAQIGTFDRDDFYFDEPEIREKYVQMNESLNDIRKYLNDNLVRIQRS